MKKTYFLILLAISHFATAQAPAGYYNSATGSGYTLKTQLKTIITSGHSDQGYNSLWSLYTNSAYRDNFYEVNNTLLDIYSERPSGTDSYEYTPGSDQCGNYSAEGICYNREHLVPQSYFDNYQVNPMKNDPFHVVPTDGWVNGVRGNLPFGVVASANYTSTNGSKRGTNLNSGYSAGFTGTVFEPIDEFKGDVARSLLYFATRYQDLMDNFYAAANGSSTQATVMFDGSINKVFNDTFLNILLTWHTNDPVSAREIAINNAVYNFQGNRNPYIDNPAYACQVWVTNCTALNLSTADFAVAELKLYPNPSPNGTVYISSEKDIDRIEVVNIRGQIIQLMDSPQAHDQVYSIENLQSGFYFIRITSDQVVETRKIIVQ
ncbi:MAG: endonuclease [Flavobacterium sp.]|nr:endonuclease [Flavobacterium sp.]